MKDLIDREMVLEELSCTRPSPKDRPQYLQWLADNKAILEVPLVQSDLDEWCPDCKEYDSKRHCCPRLNRVIRQMVKDAQSERKTGHWIVNVENENTISGSCSACGWQAHLYEDDVVGMNFCPNCGARMVKEGEEHD